MAKSSSPEADIVYSLKQHLASNGLRGARISNILVDADGSYRASKFARALEPMATVWIGGFRPDMLCSARDSSASYIMGFEVKADLADWPKGMTQARAYRDGVHYSYLAVPWTRANRRITTLERDAKNSGVGVLYLDSAGWQEAVSPEDPQPTLLGVEATATALNGVPTARRFKLNHPLNYLVVPLLRARYPAESLPLLMEKHWPDLGAAASRSYAIDGARSLGLINWDNQLTSEGMSVADLLQALDFGPERRINKYRRLANIEAPIAAVARSVLLRQPTVRLVLESLLGANQYALGMPELFASALSRNSTLARALFLTTPEIDNPLPLRRETLNSSVVFQFKQVLWHAGLLRTSTKGGKGMEAFPLHEDVWALEDRVGDMMGQTRK